MRYADLAPDFLNEVVKKAPELVNQASETLC